MVQGNFLDPIERGGVRPDQNSFDRIYFMAEASVLRC